VTYLVQRKTLNYNIIFEPFDFRLITVLSQKNPPTINPFCRFSHQVLRSTVCRYPILMRM